jgi:hypothetical protein
MLLALAKSLRQQRSRRWASWGPGRPATSKQLAMLPILAAVVGSASHVSFLAGNLVADANMRVFAVCRIIFSIVSMVNVPR